jgi:putative inorganic carbon (HCO3(-)) transporter
LHWGRREYLGAAGLILGAGSFFLLPDAGFLAGVVLAGVASLLVPPLGLLTALASLPLHLDTRSVGPLSVSFTELVILAAALGVGQRWLLRRTEGARPPPSAFDWPIALLLLSALLSLLVTEYFRLSLRELRTLILEPLLAYYLLLSCFPGRAVVWPLGAFVVAAVGVAFVGLAGLPFGLGRTEAEGVQRLQATYPSANHLGLFLGRALPWLLALVWLGGSWRGPAFVGALAVVAALFATFSIGAWLGSGVAALFLAWSLGGGRLLGIAATGAAAAGLAALVVVRAERVWLHLQPGRGTTFFRLQLWQSSVAMIRDHPFLGVGLDNFLYLYQQRYILPTALAEANLSHPHNLILHFWLQLGLLGLAAALWLVGQAFVLAHRVYTHSADPVTRVLALGAAGSLVDFVVHGMIDNSYFLPDLAIIFWLTLGVLEGCRAASGLSANS